MTRVPAPVPEYPCRRRRPLQIAMPNCKVPLAEAGPREEREGERERTTRRTRGTMDQGRTWTQQWIAPARYRTARLKDTSRRPALFSLRDLLARPLVRPFEHPGESRERERETEPAAGGADKKKISGNWPWMLSCERSRAFDDGLAGPGAPAEQGTRSRSVLLPQQQENGYMYMYPSVKSPLFLPR